MITKNSKITIIIIELNVFYNFIINTFYLFYQWFYN